MSLVLLAAAGVPVELMADEPNQAALVVQLGAGQVETRCVAFEQDEVTGADLLARSGLDVILDPASSMGIIVCQIEGKGCAHPAEPCFCQCMGGGECAYWNYFYRDPEQSEWAYSALGAALRKVRHGSVEGWVWGDGHAAPDAALSFETICAPPTPTPTMTPEPTPPTVTASAAPTEEQSPTAAPTTLPATPTNPPAATPSPAVESSAGLASYWPFGLMVLALGLVGAWVWIRRA